MKRIILKPGEETRIIRGHPWVYAVEADQILSSPPPRTATPAAAVLEAGEIADVESAQRTYLGRALVNPHSRILARIYSPSKEGLDRGFFKRRFREALERRFAAGIDLRQTSARMVFAEADFLPGLIIDRYTGWPLEDLERSLPERPWAFDAALRVLGPPGSWLSIQLLAYGMDIRREEIIAAAAEVLERDAFGFAGPLGLPQGIIEKSSAPVRELEGLRPREGIIKGSLPPGGIGIFENGLIFCLRLEEGQKTGHYLDQRENRLQAARVLGNLAARSPGRECRVLDCYTYTGGFALHAARYGGPDLRLIAADSSAAALEGLRRNRALNALEDQISPMEADIFGLLRDFERKKERFSGVILDPPAFAKRRSALEGALRGYKEINLRAIKLLLPGGILISCSCSHALEAERFKRLIAEAAADAGRRLALLEFRSQTPDHPVLIGYGESCYLKCGVYRVY
ncbi:MAG: class I SAM-dependent rRNA methyltransferase [Treponema sp.]|jgi:23S rRNA (cytosine1962-C5)-methyltransferase|nr:class I SAM-dependent rRNA methyltransferase [Treponema sp.]